MTAWPGVVVEETNCPVGDGKEGGGKGEDNVGHKVANPQRPPGGWKWWGIHWGRGCLHFDVSHVSRRVLGMHLDH